MGFKSEQKVHEFFLKLHAINVTYFFRIVTTTCHKKDMI
jgi:hypothetical protein